MESYNRQGVPTHFPAQQQSAEPFVRRELLGVHPQQAAAVQVLVVAGLEGGLPAADEGVARRQRQPQQRPRHFRRRPLLLLLALCSLRLGLVFVVREWQRAEC